MTKRQGKIVNLRILLGLHLVLLSLANLRLSASAQIIPDNTLPNNTTVTPNGVTFNIDGGTRTGNNLFHSFEQFSLLTGQTASFNNPTDIQNIISRITGSSISNIDGLIRAQGTANLFLINPNGIVFGANASLNIGGSLISSTANSILFADGTEFSASSPQAQPLLTVSIPLGLQYGLTNTGVMTVNGPGNNIGLNKDNFSLITDYRPVGLQVQSQKTLALVGGNVVITGGNLTAQQGRIELGSVGTNSFVKLNPITSGWELSYENVNSFQDISLSRAASLEVSGNSGGTIQVQGRNIQVKDASAMLADTLGNGSGGTLRIKASNSVEVLGSSVSPTPFVSYLSTDVVPKATGNGGNLLIEAKSLLVAGGAQISSGTFGSGNAGTLTVKTQELQLTGGSRVSGSSGLFTPVAPGATGNGGNLIIETDNLLITNGGQAFASTFGLGNAGSMKVLANQIEVNGSSAGGVPSGLLVNVESGATGNGGNLTIDTQSLRLINGAQIGTATLSSGNAGDLTIQANDLEIIGNSTTAPSLLFTTVTSNATGQGGTLTLDTGSLRLIDGGQIATSTAGSGKAGNLIVKATDIEVVGFSKTGRSGLFGNAIRGNGDGGNLTITTDNLTLKNGGMISASNFRSINSNISPGQGKAGNIQIEAGTILLDNTSVDNPASITASTLSGGGGNVLLNVQESLTARNGSQISADTKGAGDGGSIHINADSLAFTTGASLTTSTTGTGNAGLINIDAKSILFDGYSNDLFTGAFSEAKAESQGNGGNIQVTSDSLKLTNQARISTNSAGLGQAGNITINANKIQTNQGKIVATSTKTGGGNLNLTSNLLLLNNNSLISTSVLDSNGGGGNIKINADFVVGNNKSDIRANAIFGLGGNIQIQTQGIFFSPDSTIDASSQFGVDGIVTINNLETSKNIVNPKLSENILDPTQQIASSCRGDRANNFVVTGRGGLPENPTESIIGKTIWTDLRDLSPKVGVQEKPGSRRPEILSQTSQNTPSVIIEAQGWAMNGNGQIELLANSPNIIPLVSSNPTPNCGAN